MKKLILLATLLIAVHFTQAQLLKKLKDKVDNKVNKKVDDATSGKKDDNTNSDNSSGNNGKNESSQENPGSIKAYSKYDFVPGEKIIVFEDFMQDAVGDFPAKWNTNASGEIVTLDGKPGHWLRINKQGVFMPEFIDSLADAFTFEFDLLCDNPCGIWALYTSVAMLLDRDHPESWNQAPSRFTFTVAPGADGNSTSAIERRKDGVGEAATSTTTKQFSDKTKPVHIALWRQKERMRVYFNEEKAWDLPKAMSKEAKYSSVVYWLQGPGQNASYYMSNLRLAVGAPDTRNKILTQNKWVTHGILFDVNSATIKPESYGTLKEMATVLKENP